MPGKIKNYSPEFRDEAARLVVETSRAIADVARELGISETSLGNREEPTGKSMRKTSRRCRYPSAPGCANSSGRTENWRWKTPS